VSKQRESAGLDNGGRWRLLAVRPVKTFATHLQRFSSKISGKENGEAVTNPGHLENNCTVGDRFGN